MADEFVSYDKLIDAALRTVVCETLRHAAEHGLPGHTISTSRSRPTFPASRSPTTCIREYPDEMTIVLQHQFWGLEVTEDHFVVALTFNKIEERLEIPFDAITRFADPSVQFGLQFQTPGQGAANARTEDGAATEPASAGADEGGEAAAAVAGDGLSGADVITLDSFRKK